MFAKPFLSNPDPASKDHSRSAANGQRRERHCATPKAGVECNPTATQCLTGVQGNDYEHHVRQNVFKFMHEKLGVPADQTSLIWQAAFTKYNQTLKGLRESGFEFDVEEYWDYIRSGAEDFLSADPRVKPHHIFC